MVGAHKVASQHASCNVSRLPASLSNIRTRVCVRGTNLVHCHSNEFKQYGTVLNPEGLHLILIGCRAAQQDSGTKHGFFAGLLLPPLHYMTGFNRSQRFPSQ